MLSLAGEQVTDDTAHQYLADYAQQHYNTVRYYDYNDDLPALPSGSDGVGMGDIARLVIINARLAADDVPRLLALVDEALWAAVPHGADFRSLPENPTGEPLYEAASALYGAYRHRPGIGSTKATKLLYLKRPGLVPIIDSVVKTAYDEIARQLAEQCRAEEPMFWAAVWRDARGNDGALMPVREALTSGDERQQRVARLPLLRLHDILVWSHFSTSGTV